MQLHEALNQIAEIRTHLARTETFRGYRSLTVASSALLAFIAGVVQQSWIGDGGANIDVYLSLWVGVAAASLLLTGVELYWRHKAADSRASRHLTWHAIEQFAPCLLAGAIATYVISFSSIDNIQLLPGLWSTLFGLGILASRRLLPRATFWAGAYYLVAGGINLWLGSQYRALEAWVMPATFGTGQFLAAAILYWGLERTAETAEEQS